MREWRPVVGYENRYEVSDDGQVRSLRRALMRQRGRGRYLSVTFGDGRTIHVHVLVLQAFHGLKPSGLESAHLNGDPHDNRATNLRWTTSSENKRHKELHGTGIGGSNNPAHRTPGRRPRGSNHGAAKITEQGVRDIRQLAGAKIGQRKIAQAIGLSQRQVGRIMRGENWSHV